MLELLLSQVANGLVLGFLYVLIAIGLSVIFGMLGIVNFAHGAFFALGAYFAVTLQQQFGWPAVVFAPLLAGLVGVVVEFTLIRRLYGKEPLIGLIVTFGLALFVEAVIRQFWGAGGQPFSAPPLLSGFVVLGPVLLTTYRLAVLAATLVLLVLLWAGLVYTPFGRILRAGSRDPEMVGMLGINLPRVLTGVFGLGCCIAGVAGLLAAPLWTVTPSMASDAIMPAFVIVTIGGLGSYAGAIVAGLLVGIVTSLTVQFKPEASGAAMYVLMALILLVRPRGLFGERWERFE
ncbi:branched-chain amino acid ABC transporter permease [Paraburkholderia sp. Ac-20336]|uniref:branched-chain amino acid ABC transporter permease n=1 Tax=Burkholderiaceae TaxID=119060 RepID=UPI0014234529|nr:MULTISPECIES: branched-chain amino acid ABC transporter permease [Burkholderiaceae]MBN3801455.1 branched-chain amino acid ABC transporter permease [Paraburkholderia sp. Ac-20336]MBN3846006.1 branched-chain amino acid ABC transporter permease [Paraburkholderia sp. Ac-20342]NIF54147.1 branched-chain amino acid ABC transporter permease [Burkholderia sp. Ax-1724]NIF77742.1 branched-chain amino acid ABC transporter permease [Paraburkholderia sp. Cy-641]